MIAVSTACLFLQSLCARWIASARARAKTVFGHLKVAEHSFRARFRWCNSARAQGVKKNMPSIERSFYLLKPALTVLFFSIIERSVLMALVFYYKDLLEKVTMQRTQQFSAFVCYRKNPVKCNACAVARKIETDCFSRNVPISNDPVVRILRNLAKK